VSPGISKESEKPDAGTLVARRVAGTINRCTRSGSRSFSALPGSRGSLTSGRERRAWTARRRRWRTARASASGPEALAPASEWRGRAVVSAFSPVTTTPPSRISCSGGRERRSRRHRRSKRRGQGTVLRSFRPRPRRSAPLEGERGAGRGAVRGRGTGDGGRGRDAVGTGSRNRSVTRVSGDGVRDGVVVFRRGRGRDGVVLTHRQN
jgi:hypothetical protein